MDREALFNLKYNISNFSAEDKKKRDYYLKDFANGNIQGLFTGYPSIDKPWLKYVDLGTLANHA